MPVAAARDRRRRRRPRPSDERYADLLANATDAEPTARPTRADDPLLLYFTSGTVAAPKMVLHTHASMGAGHEITARFWQDLTPADLHWTFSDTGWAKAAWGKLFGQWRMGAAVFLWDQRGKLDPELCLRVLERSGVTTFCAPPTLFRAFVQLDLGAFDLAGVRHTVSAGEPLNPEVIRAWREATGTTIYDGYGQTETVNLVANFPCLEVRPGSMGKPTPGNDVDVVSDDGVRLGPGRGGQHRAGDGARAARRADAGLLARRRRERRGVPRRLVLHGRPRDQGRGRLLLVREPLGRRDHLGLVPDRPVRGGVGARRASRGRRVGGRRQARSRAHEHRQGVRRAGAGLRGLGRARARAAGRTSRRVTAPYKYPREIEFVDSLPKTISGKIRRSELRERS